MENFMYVTSKEFSDASINWLSEDDLKSRKGKWVFVFHEKQEIDEGIIKIKDGSVHIVNNFFDYHFIDGKPAQGASFKAFEYIK